MNHAQTTGIQRIVVRKLYRRRCIGEKHTAIEHALAGVPSHFRGAAKEALRELIKRGFVRIKPTAYGLRSA